MRPRGQKCSLALISSALCNSEWTTLGCILRFWILLVSLLFLEISQYRKNYQDSFFFKEPHNFGIDSIHCPRNPGIVELCCRHVSKLISFEGTCWFCVLHLLNDIMCMCICSLIYLFFLMLKSTEKSHSLGRISITLSCKWSQRLQ